MIHDNELRKGNCFIDPADGKTEKVLALSYEMIKVIDKNAVYYRAALPILLTPDVMISCGFVLSEEYWEKEELPFSISKDLYPVHASTWRTIGIKLEYLHQLQNLYYSLTGEELSIKELTSQNNSPAS